MPDRTPDDKTRGAVARASVNEPGIRVAVSDPALASKLKVSVIAKNEPVYWYIKFNIILDPLTVSGKSMKVTETNGYILDTEISYDLIKNLIVIKPTDPYEEGIFYILSITRRVRSKGGNRLKRDIYILFKIKDNRIEEYKMLPPDTVVEKPRKKPERLKAETAARAFGYTPQVQAKLDKTPAASLPYGKFGINLLLPVLAMPVALAGLWLGITAVVMAGGILLVAGIAHLSIQAGNSKKRAAFIYNLGVMFFNAGFYRAASKRLKKAARLDPHNELAEYAAGKVTYYNK